VANYGLHFRDAEDFAYRAGCSSRVKTYGLVQGRNFRNLKTPGDESYDWSRLTIRPDTLTMSHTGAAPRATLDLRVRVWGMAANDRAFSQNANAQNVSATGARISGLEHELKVGDVIGVQYETKKARCRVIWIIEAGGLKRYQVGVQLVTDQECPWLDHVPVGNDGAAQQHTEDNRRKYQRHKLSFPLELRDERVNMPMRLNATDISGNGCYVETVMPLPISTSLRVDFWLDQEHISASSIVRTRDPGVGMGIEFTGLTDDAKKRLQEYLEQQDPGLMTKKTSEQAD
jgi:PilZ domain